MRCAACGYETKEDFPVLCERTDWGFYAGEYSFAKNSGWKRDIRYIYACPACGTLRTLVPLTGTVKKEDET